MEKETIVFVATYPDQPIGYARVAHQLVHFLVEEDKKKVVYFGISNYHATRIQRPLDPRIVMIDVVKEEAEKGFPNEHFGIHIIADTIVTYTPSTLFLYNDVIVVCRLLNEIITAFPDKTTRPFRIVVYLDLVYPHEKKTFLRHILKHVDDIIFFSEFWKQSFMSCLGHNDTQQLYILHHAVDSTLFYPVEKKTARKRLGFPLEGFFFLNLNRNSYRKAQDLTVRSFLLFLQWIKMEKNVYLVLQCHLHSRTGYTIAELIETECDFLGFSQHETNQVLHHHILSIRSVTIDDATINDLYNACDVGLNTCVGEGFGLTNVEHAWLGKPQIVSAVGSLSDIFRDAPIPPVQPIVHLQVCGLLDEHQGMMGIIDPHDVARHMKTVFMNSRLYEQKAIDFAQRILHSAYSLETVRTNFLHLLSPTQKKMNQSAV